VESLMKDNSEMFKESDEKPEVKESGPEHYELERTIPTNAYIVITKEPNGQMQVRGPKGMPPGDMIATLRMIAWDIETNILAGRVAHQLAMAMQLMQAPVPPMEKGN
jgi:hypothetical protein